jgi:hypothetical protein
MIKYQDWLAFMASLFMQFKLKIDKKQPKRMFFES